MQMRYCNVRVPLGVARMDTSADALAMFRALVGPVDDWDVPSVGTSLDGPYEEADVWYESDGHWSLLAYDFMEVGGGTARVFRFTPDFD